MTDNELFEKQIALGWQGLSPPEGLKERVRARVWLSTSRWQALRASGPLGVGASALLIGLGFGAGYSVRPPRVVEVPASETRSVIPPQVIPPQVIPPQAIPAQLTPAEVTPAEVSTSDEKREPVVERREIEKTPAAREPVTSPKPVAAPAPATTTSADGGELGLIQRAERALRAKNPELALALSGELAERYPQSALQEERRAILLMARCQSGATDTAAEREQFRERYPDSVYTDRITSECKRAEPASP